MSPSAPASDMWLVPDALIPFAAGRPANGGRRAGDIEKRPGERRAFVLAATRCRLAELGPDKVTLRMVAADCGVSVQTVFNLVGNRSQVLSEAINDYGRAIQKATITLPNFCSGVLTLVDAMWQAAARNPAYMRQACLSYRSLGAVPHEAIRRSAVRIVRMFLLAERRRFRQDIDISLLAESIESMVSTTMEDWAFERFDLEKLRQHLAFRASTIFLGACDPSEAAGLQAGIRPSICDR